MDNKVSIRQNLPENLKCLAAQKALYSRAKKVTGFQLIMSVPVIVIISIISVVLNNNDLAKQFDYNPVDISWLVVFVSVSIALLDLAVLSPSVAKTKDKAARMQELFDCRVLGIPWNEVAVGQKPDYEEISKCSKQLMENEKEFNKLRDWYSTHIDGVPSNVSMIICQRSNLWWDADLRTAVSNYITIMAGMLFVFLLCMGIYKGLTLQSFFVVVVAPSLPVIIFATRQRIDNSAALNRVTSLKELVNRYWQELLLPEGDDTCLVDHSRRIQDQIYLNRRENPLIFDWIYNNKRIQQNVDMCYSIEQLKKEYQEAQSQ